MPLFDFICDECGYEEIDRLVVDGNVPYRCPECKKNNKNKTMIKQVSRPAWTPLRWGDTKSNKI